MTNTLCSIIIVNWNGREALRTCLKSLERFEDLSATEVIVSDNNSSDGSIEMLHKEFPHVKIIENGANIGFAAGNNRALALAKGKYVLILNPDMEFIEPGLEKLTAYMDENPGVGACGCMVLNADSSFMRQCRRGYPDPVTAFFYVSGLLNIFPSNPRIGKYFYSHVPPDREIDVDALSGSFIVARRSILEKLGGFSEDYFMFVEDVDLCRRIRETGHSLRYLPAMKIVHHGGACFEGRKNRKLFYHYQMTRSHIIVYSKDMRRQGKSMAYIAAFILIALRYSALSVLLGNTKFFSHLVEFVSIYRGDIKPLGAVE